MKIIVTGGAGFIGSNFVDYLQNKYSKSVQIVVVDSLTYAGDKQNLDRLLESPNISFEAVSICEFDSMITILEDANLVYNFAAESHVDQSINSPLKFFENNVLGTATILEASRLRKVDTFIQISTDEVYGSSNGEEWDEASSVNPSSPYSASKASADLLVSSYGKTFDMDVRITRSCNNYGPKQHDEKFIPTIIRKVLNHEQIPLYGNGTNFREWIHVQDTCEAINMVATKGKRGKIYNIGTAIRISNIQLVEIIQKLMPKYQTKIDFIKDRPGHDFGYALNSSQIQRLGFLPSIELEDGLRETIEWYTQKYSTHSDNLK